MLTLNPGFVLIAAALFVLAAPRQARAPIVGGSAGLALLMLLAREFGAATAVAQMGLPVVFLDLDELNRIFGVATLIVLVAIAIYSGARRNRSEDAAILMLAGGTVSALFVGDLISFVAAASFAGLAASWVVLASPLPGANRAGARMLIWNGVEGLLFLVGVALHLTAGAESSVFERMDIRNVGAACIFAALMVRVGAPLAHVWFKDVVSHASPVGAVALSSFTTLLGVYALARLFPAEPLLIPIGAAMIAIGAFYAAASDNLRAAAAYALIAQFGICVALIGVGSQIALAAAEGHAFAAMLAFAALHMALGAMLERLGHARLSALGGVARAIPITTMLLLAGGLAVAGAPGVALYATFTVALEATAQWELRAVWTLIAVLPGVLFVTFVLRPLLVATRGDAAPSQEAPFPMLLGASLAAFLSVIVGLSPRWLYDLMPAALTFDPFAVARVAPQLELLGVAGIVFAVLWTLGLAKRGLPARLLDIDALYRGPVAAAGRWGGVLALRAYGAWRSGAGRGLKAAGRKFTAWAESLDRPFANQAFSGLAQLLSVAILLVIMLLSASLG